VTDPYQELPDPHTHRQILHHGNVVHATNTEHTACGVRVHPGATDHDPATPVACGTCTIRTDTRRYGGGVPTYLHAGAETRYALHHPPPATNGAHAYAVTRALQSLHIPDYLRTSPHIADILDALAQGDYTQGLDWGFPDTPDTP
jgi:hypothetical protein